MSQPYVLTVESVVLGWVEREHPRLLERLMALQSDPSRFATALADLESHWAAWGCEQARHWSPERRQRLWAREDQALEAGLPQREAERWAWRITLAEVPRPEGLEPVTEIESGTVMAGTT
jgi:hypothetical protein